MLLLGGLVVGNPSLRAEVKVGEQQGTTVSASVEQDRSATSTQTVTREELDGVRSELATLQERLDRTYERNTAQTLRPLFVTGVAQLRYTQQENRYSPSAVGNTGNHQGGFSLNALILNFQGNLKRDFEDGRNINYLFSLASPGDLTLGAGSATWDYAVKPLDAYISYHVRPSLDPEGSILQVVVGQQKRPFGLEALAAEDKKPTILSAQSARPNLGALDAGNNTGTFPSTGLGLDGRDIGLVVKGDLFPKFDPGFRYRVAAVEYQFGVFNGAGANKLDNNGRKDIVGRLVLNAPVDYSSIFRGLSIGGSYYNGKSYSGAAAALGNTDVKRWGADIAYVNTPIGFTYEHVHGQDNTTKKQGNTLTIFYNYGEQFVTGYKYQDRYDDWYPTTFQPFVRFDWWSPNTALSDNVTEITTIGVNWFLAQTTKLQLNYNIVNLSDRQAAAYGGPRNQFLAQVQYTF
jgi:hypothetical protein